jgi:hypothetical protein
MFGSLAPFGAQLIGNQSSRRHKVPHTLLGAKNPASQCRNAQLVVLHAQMHRVANTNSERLAYCSRNNQPTFFADLRPGLKFYLSLHNSTSG